MFGNLKNNFFFSIQIWLQWSHSILNGRNAPYKQLKIVAYSHWSLAYARGGALVFSFILLSASIEGRI